MKTKTHTARVEVVGVATVRLTVVLDGKECTSMAMMHRVAADMIDGMEYAATYPEAYDKMAASAISFALNDAGDAFAFFDAADDGEPIVRRTR